jgi:hypothetical protein
MEAAFASSAIITAILLAVSLPARKLDHCSPAEGVAEEA